MKSEPANKITNSNSEELISAKSVACVIPAAGLSSRMGAFKPLLHIAGRPLLAWTIDSVWQAGIRKIFLILGKKADSIQAALQDCLPDSCLENLNIIVNPDFATSDMLRSIQIGLEQLIADQHNCAELFSAVCVLPGDHALIDPMSIRVLINAHQQQPEMLFCLCHLYQRGHPLVLPKRTLASVLAYHGEGGLNSALADDKIVNIPVYDPGVLLDANQPEDIPFIDALLHSRIGIPPN